MNRIQDFINFHNKSCIADTIVEQLKEYCNLMNYNDKNRETVVLLYSLTYSIPSTIIIMNKMQDLLNNPNKFWEENKQKLIFQSDRKYVKINNAFIKSFLEFDKNIFLKLKGKNNIDVKKTVEEIEKNYFFSRFSAFLFLETYCCMFNKETYNNHLDWQNGATVTSGMFNVLGYDNYADLWDKEHKIKIDIDYFDKVANELLKRVQNGKNLFVLETNLCAYRKLFKGTRYLGYYTDRILEELYKTIKNYPEHKSELNYLFLSREYTIPKKYLGEKNNWIGIRKELKKYYLKNGVWEW